MSAAAQRKTKPYLFLRLPLLYPTSLNLAARLSLLCLRASSMHCMIHGQRTTPGHPPAVDVGELSAARRAWRTAGGGCPMCLPCSCSPEAAAVDVGGVGELLHAVLGAPQGAAARSEHIGDAAGAALCGQHAHALELGELGRVVAPSLPPVVLRQQLHTRGAEGVRRGSGGGPLPVIVIYPGRGPIGGGTRGYTSGSSFILHM
eukprot:539126-Pyramimonas_sp.AAC.1